MWSQNWEHASWIGTRSSLSRPRIYIIVDHCGKRIGSIIRDLILIPVYVDHECILLTISAGSVLGAAPREMPLVLLSVDHACILSMISVVSELGAFFVERDQSFFK